MQENVKVAGDMRLRYAKERIGTTGKTACLLNLALLGENLKAFE